MRNISFPTKRKQFSHVQRSNVMLAGLAVALLLMAAPRSAAGQDNDGRTPDLGSCQNLEVPEANKVAFHVYAEGVQIYRWDGASWTFMAPEAVLFADAGGHGTVGVHYTGPSWESNSGSKVVGAVLERCTPNPESIPWLLLGVASKEGQGVFARVNYIQRVNTVGGTPPTYAGTVSGELARVPYTAEYYFYRPFSEPFN